MRSCASREDAWEGSQVGALAELRGARKAAWSGLPPTRKPQTRDRVSMGGPGGRVQTFGITSLSNLVSVRKQNNLEKLSERKLKTGARDGREVYGMCVCERCVHKDIACSQACVPCVPPYICMRRVHL